MKNKKYVLVEFKNCAPFVYQIASDKKITLNKVVKYFVETWGFNEERDNITLLDDITTVNL